jgi:hypothetical protein
MLPSRLTSHARRLPNPRYSPDRRRRAEFARWSRKGLPVPTKMISQGMPHGEYQQRFGRQQDDDDWLLTRSGSHSPSATPYSLSVAVPATTKSLGVVIQPMLSRSVAAASARRVRWCNERRARNLDSRVHVADEGFRVRVDGRRCGNTGDDRFNKVRSEPSVSPTNIDRVSIYPASCFPVTTSTGKD